jgi:peptidoglycan-associated lipoprotein
MRKGLILLAIITVMGMFLFSGCPKKEVVKPEPAPAVTKEVAPPKPAETKIGEEALKAKERELLAKVEETPKLQDIHFDFDKYTIRDDAKEILDKNAAWLKKNPNLKIQIEGHCDERGTNEYNLALGDRRSKSTKDYLIFLGIDPARISTISFGEEKPLDPGHNEEAWAKNRRSHFVIMK